MPIFESDNTQRLTRFYLTITTVHLAMHKTQMISDVLHLKKWPKASFDYFQKIIAEL